jgi:hypothetical protein
MLTQNLCHIVILIELNCQKFWYVEFCLINILQFTLSRNERNHLLLNSIVSLVTHVSWTDFLGYLDIFIELYLNSISFL